MLLILSLLLALASLAGTVAFLLLCGAARQPNWGTGLRLGLFGLSLFADIIAASALGGTLHYPLAIMPVWGLLFAVLKLVLSGRVSRNGKPGNNWFARRFTEGRRRLAETLVQRGPSAWNGFMISAGLAILNTLLLTLVVCSLTLALQWIGWL